MPWNIKSTESYNMAFHRIQEKLDRIAEEVPRATLEALEEVATDCISRSVARAPVDKGDLRGTGFVDINGQQVAMGRDDKSGGIDITGSPGQPQDGTNEALIGFSSEYAFVQHEHMEFNHPQGGQAKFLELTIHEQKEAWLELLRDAAVSAFRGDG